MVQCTVLAGDIGSIPGPGRFLMPRATKSCVPQPVNCATPAPRRRVHALKQEKMKSRPHSLHLKTLSTATNNQPKINKILNDFFKVNINILHKVHRRTGSPGEPVQSKQ